jgi:hypothetical protein
MGGTGWRGFDREFRNGRGLMWGLEWESCLLCREEENGLYILMECVEKKHGQNIFMSGK